jgi:hypothetical protein
LGPISTVTSVRGEILAHHPETYFVIIILAGLTVVGSSDLEKHLRRVVGKAVRLLQRKQTWSTSIKAQMDSLLKGQDKHGPGRLIHSQRWNTIDRRGLKQAKHWSGFWTSEFAEVYTLRAVSIVRIGFGESGYAQQAGDTVIGQSH